VIVEVIAPAPTVLDVLEPAANVLEVSYVRGLTGAQGEQGIQGVKGDTGATGATGATGPQGEQGIQGVKGDKGDTGDTGPQGSSGVVSVTAPITNSGTSTAANIGIDQTGLTLAQSQITGLVTALGAKAALTASQTFTGTQSILTGAIGNTGLVVRAAAGQTSNLILGQDSNGTSIFRVRENGRVAVGTSVFSAGFSVDLTNIGAGTIGAVIRGAVGMTANLQEWQNSAGSVLARVDQFGNMYGNTLFGTVNVSDLAVMGVANSGGTIRLARATALLAAPANQVRLQILAGTTGSRLVAVGPNGTAYTILDNIV
jgi:hypothetical protein